MSCSHDICALSCSRGEITAIRPDEEAIIATINEIVDGFEHLICRLDPDIGNWQDDTGALTLKHLFERQGIDVRLGIGIFVWENLEEKYRIIEGSDPELEDLADYWAEENQHWLVVRDSRLSEGPILIDPNAELKLRPRMVRLRESTLMYRDGFTNQSLLTYQTTLDQYTQMCDQADAVWNFLNTHKKQSTQKPVAVTDKDT